MQDESLGAAELGQKLGYGWAKMSRQNRVAMRVGDGLIEPVAEVGEGLIPEPVRNLVMEQGARDALDAYEDPNSEREFWAAFIEGVRAYLAEQTELGMGDN